MSLCLRSIQEFNWGEANSFLHSLPGHFLCWLSAYFLASISIQTNVFHSSFLNWRKFWTVTMNSLYTFTFKWAHIRVLCLIKFAWSSFHIWKVLTIIINISHLLGLYVENIGLPGLGSRDWASSLHGVNRIYIRKCFIFRLYCIIATERYVFILWMIPLNFRVREHLNSYFSQKWTRFESQDNQNHHELTSLVHVTLSRILI